MSNIKPFVETHIGGRTVKVFRDPEVTEKDARSILDRFMEKMSNGRVVDRRGESEKDTDMDFMIIQKDHTLMCGHKSDDHSSRMIGVVLKNIKPEEVNQPIPLVGNYDGAQLKIKVPKKIRYNGFKLTE